MVILISEDDEGIRSVMEMIFTLKGATVYTATNGEEALALLMAGNVEFDALVTDFNMPKMNGDELVKEVFKRNIQLKKIIMISGRWDNSSDMEELMKEHSNIQCLFKPVAPDTISGHLLSFT
ncbi:MAG: response regulator [Bacteriovoracia bacterium]